MWECSHHYIIKLNKSANVVGKPTRLSLKLVRESEEVQCQIYINVLLQKIYSGLSKDILSLRSGGRSAPEETLWSYTLFSGQDNLYKMPQPLTSRKPYEAHWINFTIAPCKGKIFSGIIIMYGLLGKIYEEVRKPKRNKAKEATNTSLIVLHSPWKRDSGGIHLTGRRAFARRERPLTITYEQAKMNVLIQPINIKTTVKIR